MLATREPMRRRISVPPALVLLASAAQSLACSGIMADHNGRQLGDDLGRFHVAAKLEQSSCGPGALGSTDNWEFDVDLSRDGSKLYWKNGSDPVTGQVAGDGVSFTFDSQSIVPVAPKKGAQLGCTVARVDSAAGTLAASGTNVESFTGSLKYAYSTDDASDCSSLIDVEGGFSQLPCDIGYKMTATRTVAPKQ